MQDFKPHSFDTSGFVFGVKLLACVLVIATGAKYGVAFAKEHHEMPEVPAEAHVAAAETALPSIDFPEAKDEAPPAFHTDLPVPKVTAAAFLVANLSDGTIYASKDAETPFPIASISKLLTSLVARDVFTASTSVTMTPEDWRHTEGSPGSIQRTDTFTVQDLFVPLLTESNNSVANAFARTYGKDEFIRLLLRKAHSIGMDETLMQDPSGLSENNSASAHDLLRLTQTFYREAPDLLAITRSTSNTITAVSGRKYSFPNFNVFAKNPLFIGGKTGYTDEALETMTTIFQVPEGNASTTIAVIVLHSQDRKADIEKLLAWYKAAAK